MNLQKYINRIGFTGQLSSDIKCLKLLHRKHVMAVPFEAMDVQFKKPIKLDLPNIYNKVVAQNRGGYCYELNFLFHTLLTQIGFKSAIVSSRIYKNKSYGPEFDHMSIVVNLEEPWLVDVGYGDLFLDPLKISSGLIQEHKFKNYKLENIEQTKWLLSESLKNKTEYINKYMFDLQARSIDEFLDQNNYKQYSPQSYFVKNLICTRPTQNGRITILNDVFKRKTNNHVVERKIKGKYDLMKLLKTEFNLTIENTTEMQNMKQTHP